MSQRLFVLILPFIVCSYETKAQIGNFCPVNMLQLYNGVTCQTDQSCQHLSNGFFCYRGHCCANAVSLPGGYGSSCAAHNQCSFAQAECLAGLCYCRAGFNYDGQRCQPSQFNDNLLNPITANQLLTQQCTPNQISIGGQCYPLQNYFDECEFNQQCNFVGGICNQRRCSCLYTDIFNGLQCVKDSMISASVSCQANQVFINNQCYPTANLGEPCVYDQQCSSNPLSVSPNVACINGVCQQIGIRPRDQRFSCTNPAASVETFGNVVKNCLTMTCSPGYHCEYNAAMQQYVCCGSNLDGLYGQVKMYPGYSNLPLQCTGINSCTFVDFPNCVYSQSYKHNVCCSTSQCL